MLWLTRFFTKNPNVTWIRLSGRRLVQLSPGDYKTMETGKLVLCGVTDQTEPLVIRIAEELGATLQWQDDNRLAMEMPHGEGAANLAKIAERSLKRELS